MDSIINHSLWNKPFNSLCKSYPVHVISRSSVPRKQRLKTTSTVAVELTLYASERIVSRPQGEGHYPAPEAARDGDPREHDDNGFLKRGRPLTPDGRRVYVER